MAKTEPSEAVEFPIAILAGSGRLPQILVSGLEQNARDILVIELVSDAGPWPEGIKSYQIPPTQLGAVLATLKREKIRTIVMAGGLSVRPRLRDFRMDRVFLRYLLSSVVALMKGDDGLLSTVVRKLENEGFKVKGAHDIVPSLLAPLGTMTIRQPGDADEKDILLASAAARMLGAKDKGQAAIARLGKVLALEDRSGTAAMLASLADAINAGTLSGVLAKVSKPGQELRVDMPAIGPDTVIQASRACLAGIVVEAGHALLIDRDEIIRQANEHGLFVCGRKVADDRTQ